MMGDREELLRLAYMKLMDAVELLQSIGEDLLADEVRPQRPRLAVPRSVLRRPGKEQGPPGQGSPRRNLHGLADNSANRYSEPASGDRLIL